MTWMKYMLVKLLFILLIVFNYPAYAVSLDFVSLDELFKKSDVVVHIKITEASVGYLSEKNTEYCDYWGEIINLFKGIDNKKISFESYEGLEIGSEYVLFLRHYENSYIASPILGEIFEFHREYGANKTKTWLKNSASHIKIPKDIMTLDVKYRSVDQSDYYPSYISYLLVDWEEFNAHLLKLNTP
ncbi:MAG: hypothetical protein H6912_06865 [Kordiimonadaceae bacterium]|nr:hypothetical protein [Kordiimonadaceae bacterium]